VRADLEVAIVHHRTPTLLLSALELLARHAPGVPVTIVDTAFDASLPQQLDGVHPHLRWLPAENHSYAHAVNLGLRATTSPLVASMNADVFVGARTLEDLAAAFADPSVALAGPIARTPSGAVQDLGLPYRRHLAHLRWRGRDRAGAAGWISVPWLSGCLLVARRAALARCGGMDGSLRFYNEDLEWGRRCRAAGYRCALVDTEVVHVGGAATPPDGRFLIEGLRGGYALSRRYAPPTVRALHRWAIAGFASGAAHLARDEGRRATWREVARRFVRHALDAAPFGATLADDAAVLSDPPGDPSGR
jgi:N-acetylglucosaminyl-diphospho-decaprenol L-rhamnosyltransferase